MSILAWIFLGLIAGFIASRIVDSHGQGVALDVVLGIVGALVGGFLFHLIGASGAYGFNLWSLCVATIGAIVVLTIGHAVTGRRLSH
jgi:uncharacterized membrane protein YeaQ/YmgE (transglycosylase-associated protein family)